MKNSFCFLGLILLFACTSNPQKPEKSIQTNEKTEKETSRHSVSGAKKNVDNPKILRSWEGTYFATLPCGRCEGIEMWISLYSDDTYLLLTNYLGLNDALEEEFTGKFFLDEQTKILRLEGLKDTYPGLFKMGEKQLLYLDSNGKAYAGAQADQYILYKK